MRIINLQLAKDGSVTPNKINIGHDSDHLTTKLIFDIADEVKSISTYYRVFIDDMASEDLELSLDGLLYYTIPGSALKPGLQYIELKCFGEAEGSINSVFCSEIINAETDYSLFADLSVDEALALSAEDLTKQLEMLISNGSGIEARVEENMNTAVAAAGTASDKADIATNMAESALNNAEAAWNSANTAKSARDEAVEFAELLDDVTSLQKVKEHNNGEYLSFWVGTRAEYEALEEKPQNCLCLFSDDTSLEELKTNVEALLSRPYIMYSGSINATPGSYTTNSNPDINYEIYSNGTYQIHGFAKFRPDITIAAGSLYRSEYSIISLHHDYITSALPVTLKCPEYSNVNGYCVDRPAIITQQYPEGSTSDWIIKFATISYTSTAYANVGIRFHLIGKWQNKNATTEEEA